SLRHKLVCQRLFRLASVSDFVLHQNSEWLDQELARRLAQVKADYTPQIDNIIVTLQQDITLNRQRYRKDAANYRQTLRDPQQLDQALQERLDIADAN
ncbi:hypothetical protein BGZ83_004541, partial [Gryganskiella cystojenkinii]